MASYTNITVPVPAAYSRSNTSYWPQPNESKRPSTHTSTNSYGSTSDFGYDSELYSEAQDHKLEPFQVEDETESLKGSHDVKRSKNLAPAYILVFLSKSRYWIRGFAVLIMILSIALILTGVTKFSHAKGNANFESVPKPAPITDHPCIVFSGIAAMNLVLSIVLLLTSCFSSKFRKSNDLITAIFTITSAIGFSSSMGACFFLNRQTTLRNDLWKWSCQNQQQGIKSTAIDFGQVCHIIAYSWRFGLVQAGLELLTFIISCSTFVMLRWFDLSKYGIR